jgi:hypothetical protein
MGADAREGQARFAGLSLAVIAARSTASLIETRAFRIRATQIGHIDDPPMR